MTDIERLRGFAKAILNCWPGDADGLVIQEAAEEFGLFEKFQTTEPCGEHCDCLAMDNGECEVACECVNCGDCGGSGHYYVNMRGQYIGQHRGDDLDDMENCDTCGGSGISETCHECQEALTQDDQP